MRAGLSNTARLMASQGYSVFVIYYFERTGTVWADHGTTRANFSDWMRTIGDAITFAGQHASVDANRIGLLGFSLGAYLALFVASVEPRVKAVVEFFGGMPEELHGFTRMPSVLILHGEQDRVVTVTEATRLQHLLERSGTPNEKKLYPGAIAVLREAVAAGVHQIETSDFYGPHVTNRIVKKALHPYPEGLVLVTKGGARRGEDKFWQSVSRIPELSTARHQRQQQPVLPQ